MGEWRPSIQRRLACRKSIRARALAYRAAGDQAARRYRFDEAAAFARKATAIDADDPQAHFDLGLYLMRTGDEKSARTALERSWDLDKSAGVTKNLLDVLDKIDKFEVVTSGDFVFKFATEEAAVLRAYALPLAAEAYKTFSARYGFTPSGPLLIEIFPDARRLCRPHARAAGAGGRARRVLRPRRVHGFAARPTAG